MAKSTITKIVNFDTDAYNLFCARYNIQKGDFTQAINNMVAKAARAGDPEYNDIDDLKAAIRKSKEIIKEHTAIVSVKEAELKVKIAEYERKREEQLILWRRDPDERPIGWGVEIT